MVGRRNSLGSPGSPLRAQVLPIEADRGIGEGNDLNYHGIALEVSKTLERAIWSQAIIGLDFSKKNHMYD